MEAIGAAHSWLDAAIPLAAGLAFAALLLVAAVADCRRGIVPDAVVLGGTAAALVAGAVFPRLHHAGDWREFFARNVELFWLLPDWSGGGEWKWGLAAALIGAASGLAAGLTLYYAGGWLFGRRGGATLGMGDVKLLVFIGAFLGWKGMFAALLAASLSGAAVGALWRRRGVVAMPFAPFLAAAAVGYFCLSW